jgi:hypothetical protein
MTVQKSENISENVDLMKTAVNNKFKAAIAKRRQELGATKKDTSLGQKLAQVSNKKK